MFIGSEGTLGIVVEAILKLIPKPETSRVVLAYFDDVDSATKSVNAMIDANLRPSTIDFMNKNGYSLSFTEYEKIDEDSKPLNIYVSGPDKVNKHKMYNYD